MLRRLLGQIADTGTARSTELAHALGMSPALVEPMIEELARHGYLRLFVPGRAAPCERCPVRAACLYRRQPRVWALSAKGLAVVEHKPDAPPIFVPTKRKLFGRNSRHG